MSYKTRDQMLSAWAQFPVERPDLVSVETAGKTVEGRNIPFYKVGNPNGGRVMFNAGVHGFEKTGVEVLFLFADWLLHSTEPQATRIRERNLVILLPILDLDEYPNTTGMNANWVNIYRNFNYRWGMEKASHTKGTSLTQWTQYCGPYVESEPETLVLKNIWLKYFPKSYVDIHVGSSGFKTWYSGLADVVDKQKMIAVGAKYTSLAKAMGRSVMGWGDNAYSSGCPVSASYHNTGKKTLGYVTEISTQNPPYSTVVSTHFPNFKPLGITVCQESELFVLDVQASANGITQPTVGRWLCEPSSTIMVVATPDTGFESVGWELDGVSITDADGKIELVMNADHVLKAIFHTPPYVECEAWDANTKDEFQILLNDELLFSCPTNAANAQKWVKGKIVLPLTISDEHVTNKVTLRNPTTAYCKVRNVKIVVNDTVIINDTTTTVLQSSEKNYEFS